MLDPFYAVRSKVGLRWRLNSKTILFDYHCQQFLFLPKIPEIPFEILDNNENAKIPSNSNNRNIDHPRFVYDSSNWRAPIISSSDKNGNPP